MPASTTRGRRRVLLWSVGLALLRPGLSRLLLSGSSQERGRGAPSSGASSFAVVRPFWAGELSTLRDALLKPSAPKACERGPLQVDLVLYYAGGANASVDESLQSLVGELAKDPCYARVLVKHAGIGRSVGYPAAPCTQFVDMFTTSTPLWGYDAVYWMELDVRPVKDGWLELILPTMAEAARGDVWVVGGVYNLRCMVAAGKQTLWHEMREDGASSTSLRRGNEWWNNRHINGNAIYSASSEFVDWVKANWGSRQGGAAAATDRCEAEGGFDEIMFLDARRKPELSGGHERYREDPRFMDCKPVGPHKSATTMDIDELRAAFPDAVLVHSQGGHQSTAFFLEY